MRDDHLALARKYGLQPARVLELYEAATAYRWCGNHDARQGLLELVSAQLDPTRAAALVDELLAQ